MSDNQEQSGVLAETENFIIWKTEDEDDVIYHIELGGVTLHVESMEWDELVTLFKSVA